MKYFAYGSNMDPEQMARRCPGGISLGRARLADHRLGFTYDSVLWGGGVASVEPSPGDETWGVLWELDDVHLATLDGYEQVASGVYRRATVGVEAEDGSCEALIYIATDTKDRRPSKRYLRTLLRGARAHSFPEQYIRRIEAARVWTRERTS